MAVTAPRWQARKVGGRCGGGCGDRVRDARPAERAALATLLARAFARDPVYRWIVPDDAHWQRVAPGFFREILALYTDTGLVLTTERGVALWNPPEPRARPFGAGLAFALRVCARLGRATPRLARAAGALASLHPREPHWYLGVIGVEPDHQRRGIGTRLMAGPLARCDAEGLPACLETAAPGNLAFYRARGFEVTGEVSVAGGPAVWALRRAPRDS